MTEVLKCEFELMTECECELRPGRVLKREFELRTDIFKCEFELMTEVLKCEFELMTF